jgi:hypothetical protein
MLARRGELALTLLVTRIGADDENAPLALHQLAVFADPLDARTHLHDNPLDLRDIPTELCIVEKR